MNAISIEFSNVSKIYKLPNGAQFEALKPIHLQIYSGECFGLLGHNGAGKTTLLNLLAGVNTPTTGDIFVEGLSVKNNTSEVKRLLGVVQQELIADSFFDLRTMLTIQSKLSGYHPDKEWIDFLLEKLLLAEHRKKTTRELSGGMKRRMMIARALVHKPKILILDEPTAGVDVELRRTMWCFVENLHKQGMTIILTTHYLQEAEDFCSRIAIIKKGEIVTLKQSQEMLALGGKHKISCLIIINNVTQWLEENLNFLRQNSILAEPIKTAVKNNCNLKLSMTYIHGSMTSFIDAAKLLNSMINELKLKVFEICTESPDLEDVFIKINAGDINNNY
jgi:ABC-2 type transport system ATP-binding protein